MSSSSDRVAGFQATMGRLTALDLTANGNGIGVLSYGHSTVFIGTLSASDNAIAAASPPSNSPYAEDGAAIDSP